MAEQQETSNKPSRVSLKTLLILIGVLALEGGVITGLFLVMGGPAEVHADAAADDEAARAEQPVEVSVVSDRFQNTRTGRSYLYDADIYVIVQQRHREHVQEQLEQMHAQITSDVATIFRRAEPSHLLEPELSTLKRQLQAALDNRLGYDEDGEPYVRDALIGQLTRFRGDM
ncbi:MAG: hypothetical protein WD009_02515 [Phycisphaeraceae bacterium]